MDTIKRKEISLQGGQACVQDSVEGPCLEQKLRGWKIAKTEAAFVLKINVLQ